MIGGVDGSKYRNGKTKWKVRSGKANDIGTITGIIEEIKSIRRKEEERGKDRRTIA